MPSHLLGIDVGTSGTKAILIDREGKIKGWGVSEYPLHTPEPGWCEQDPADWWRATVGAVKMALRSAQIPGQEVHAVGLTGQMHGSVFLDARGEVIRPALLWCDQRTVAECEEITALAGGLPRLLKLTGNPVLTGFTAPKVVWLRNHEPANYERVRHLLLPKDYLRFRLTGELATEVSDASGTSLFDVRRRAWSREMISLLEIAPEWLPPCYESPEVSGRVTAQAAELLGLAAGTPVVGGGGDQATGAVGNGIVVPGLASAVIGTSGVVFAHTEKPLIDPEGRLHCFCHTVPGKWHVMGVTLAAGGSLRWYRDQLAGAETETARLLGKNSYELIAAAAGTVPAGSEGLLFLPYLAGERTPYPDPHARGVFFGLSLRHTKAHLARAIMEGVAFSLRDCLELMRRFDIPVGEIRASGGGGKSPLWRAIMAAVCDTPVVVTNADEGPSFGAALLAGVGTGVYASVEEACRATIREENPVAANREAVSRYECYYQVCRNLYPKLKEEFRIIHGLQG